MPFHPLFVFSYSFPSSISLPSQSLIPCNCIAWSGSNQKPLLKLFYECCNYLWWISLGTLCDAVNLTYIHTPNAILQDLQQSLLKRDLRNIPIPELHDQYLAQANLEVFWTHYDEAIQLRFPYPEKSIWIPWLNIDFMLMLLRNWNVRA